MNGRDELNPFLLNFFGQVVSVITTQNVTSSIITAEGPIVETYPLSFEGILLDEDDHFLYLAKKVDNVSLAIDKKQIVGIEIVSNEAPEEKNVFTDILNEMGSPENDEDLN